MNKPILIRSFKMDEEYLFILYSVYSHSLLHRGLEVLIIFKVVLFSLRLALLKLFGGGTCGLASLVCKHYPL